MVRSLLRRGTVRTFAQWYVVQTKPGMEWAVHRALHLIGYRSHCLHMHGTVCHGRRKIGVLRPYYPGYVFVRIQPEQDLWAVDELDDVVTVLPETRAAVPIPRSVMRNELRRGDKAGLVSGRAAARRRKLLDNLRKEIRPGFQFTLLDGPIAGSVATLHLDKRNRLIVLVGGGDGKVSKIEVREDALLASPEWQRMAETAANSP